MKHSSPGTFDDAEPFTTIVDLPDLETLKQVEFLEDASVRLLGQKTQQEQEVGPDQSAAPPLYVSRASIIATIDSVVDGLIEPIHEPRKAKRKGPGRPPKRGRPKVKGPDKRKRVMMGPITMAGRRDILDAVQFARHMGHDLDMTINFQPVHLDSYPEATDLGMWFRNGIMRDLATFFAREKDRSGRPLQWWGFATRESYIGHRREHLHVVLWCPPGLRKKLLVFLRRRYPGGNEPGRIAVHVGDLKAEGGVNYRLKQMEGNAAGPVREGRPVAETKSRWDGAEVASVYGKRYTISRTLALPARSRYGWQQQQDEKRRVRSISSRAQREADKHSVSVFPTVVTPPNAIESSACRL